MRKGPAPLHRVFREPSLGKNFTVSLNRAAAGGVSVRIFGISNKRWLGFTLPLNLTPYGFPGCNLYVSMDMLFPRPTNSPGYSSVSFMVPNVPSLAGVATYWQWAASDRALSMLLQFSNALEAEVY